MLINVVKGKKKSINSRKTGQVILLRIGEICYDRERMASRRALVEGDVFAAGVNLPMSSLEKWDSGH